MRSAQLAQYLHTQEKLSPSTFFQARKKVGSLFFKKLITDTYQLFTRENAGKNHWNGLQVFGIDGSYLNLPKQLVASKYKRPKGGFYPQGILSLVYDLNNKIPVSVSFNRHKNERRAATKLLSSIPKGSLVVMDRGYPSLKLLDAIQKRGLYFAVRFGKRTFGELEAFSRSGNISDKMTIKRGPTSIQIRAVRYQAKGKTYHLATNLPNSKKFSIKALKEIYHRRWNIEEGFKSLKQTLGLRNIRSRTCVGVKQEIFVKVLSLLLSRLMTRSTAQTTKAKSLRASTRVGHLVTTHLLLNCPKASTARYEELIGQSFRTATLLGRSFVRISHRPLDKFRFTHKKRAMLMHALKESG